MEVLKKVDEANVELIELQQAEAKKRKYIDREEDPQIKKMFEEEQKRFESLHEQLKGKVDGEIDMDMHGNVTVRQHGELREAE